MGMTIEAQIKALEYLKKCGIFPFSDTRTGIVFTDECIDGAIDTMRKYQKIKEIIQHWIDVDLACESPSFADSGTIEDIIEVLEDGSN